MVYVKTNIVYRYHLFIVCHLALTAAAMRVYDSYLININCESPGYMGGGWGSFSVHDEDDE